MNTKCRQQTIVASKHCLRSFIKNRIRFREEVSHLKFGFVENHREKRKFILVNIGTVHIFVTSERNGNDFSSYSTRV